MGQNVLKDGPLSMK